MIYFKEIKQYFKMQRYSKNILSGKEPKKSYLIKEGFVKYVQERKNLISKDFRNYLVSIIKLSYLPYKVEEDYFKNRLEYAKWKLNGAFTPENGKNILPGTWVTIMGDGNYPVKGKRFCEYFINSSSLPKLKTYKVLEVKISTYDDSVDLVLDNGNNYNEIWIDCQQARLATKKEIEETELFLIEEELKENVNYLSK